MDYSTITTSIGQILIDAAPILIALLGVRVGLYGFMALKKNAFTVKD